MPRNSGKPVVAKSDISAELRRLGLAAGDTAVVHSSLSSMGHVEGGADTVIDAFLDVVGAEGTLVMPAFSFIWDKRTESMSVPPFDPTTTPSRMGVITETFRKRRGTIRSNHRSHSWCASGRSARLVLYGEAGRPKAGESISWDAVFGLKGQVVLLGVHYNRCNVMHYVEHSCADVLPHVPLMYAGDPYPRTRADHGVFNGIERHLVDRGVARNGRIGSATVRVAGAKALVETAVKVVRTVDRAVLLCDDPRCAFCAWARERYGTGRWEQPARGE
jgi:aminoglycoside 3-N-acetyltransferase